MLCAISGEAPQVPVVSPKSGSVFEKRLIEAYVAENGKDPVNGDELTADDLIEVKSQRVVQPRPPTLTSIPSLLSVFQNEWDSLALETYTLQQTLAQTRQELSAALYQHDAAVRVIARLTKERDEARDALSKVSVGASRGGAAGGEAMQVDAAGLPEAVTARIESTQAALSKTRRKRPVPEGWASSEAISSFQPVDSTQPICPGGKALAVHASGDLALVGGADGALIYSLSQKQVVSTLATNGAVTDAVFAGDKAVVASATGVVKVFENGNEVADFPAHAGAATALAVHPTGDLVASVGADKSYVLYDLTTNAVLTQVFSNAALLSLHFHPDGHLLAAGGVDGQIKIFDVKTGDAAATYAMGGPVKCLFFSENGTFLAAVADQSSIVSIWDLRSSTEIKSLDTGSAVEALNWDYTGQFLLTGGRSGVTVQQYSKASKSWTEPLRSAVPAVSVAWGAQAQQVVALTAEGGVTVLGAP